MKKTSNTTKKGRGRPKKIVEFATKTVAPQKVGIPAFTEPTDYDLHDELVRLDSYTYSRHNS